MGGRIIATALNTFLTCIPLLQGSGQLLVAVVFNKAFVPVGLPEWVCPFFKGHLTIENFLVHFSSIIDCYSIFIAFSYEYIRLEFPPGMSALRKKVDKSVYLQV